MRKILLILVGTIGLSVPWYNLAAKSTEWKQNTQLLPQYCKDAAKRNQSAEYEKWRGTLGEAFIHMNHYCDGIYSEQKAKSTIDQKDQKRWLQNAQNQMRYVSKHCSTSCVLYPDLHTRWGWALGVDGKHSEAIRHFQLAIGARPEYAPAYAKLSDLYLKIGKPNEARRVLDEGLKAKPGSRMLQRRLEKLDTM